MHVDGLDWLRGKWGAVGKRYFRANVRLAVRLADEIIADAVEIRNYYRRHYRTESVLLRYGAPILDATDCTRLRDWAWSRRATTSPWPGSSPRTSWTS